MFNMKKNKIRELQDALMEAEFIIDKKNDIIEKQILEIDNLKKELSVLKKTTVLEEPKKVKKKPVKQSHNKDRIKQ